MHGSMSIKLIKAKQAVDIRACKNTKRKLFITNAVIWFNKTCGDKELKPSYIKDPFPTQPWQRPVTIWAYKPEAANTV
jgi:hypothetical protein